MANVFETRTAQQLQAAFVRKERTNGESFYTLADGSPDWMLEAIRNAHQEALPNDWSYDTAHTMAGAILEALENDQDVENRIMETANPDLLAPYTAQRTSWLGSHAYRLSYCDEALEEGLVAASASLEERIAAGIYLEARRIGDALYAAIQEEASDWEDRAQDDQDDQENDQ